MTSDGQSTRAEIADIYKATPSGEFSADPESVIDIADKLAQLNDKPRTQSYIPIGQLIEFPSARSIETVAELRTPDSVNVVESFYCNNVLNMRSAGVDRAA